MSPNESSAAVAAAYLLSSEDPAEFAELRRELEHTHQPANAHERILVEEFAHSYWELRRVRRIDREFWEYVGSHYSGGEAGIAEALVQEKEARFRTHLRLRTQAERSYYRALAALERMHRDRNRRPALIRRENTVAAPGGPALTAAPPKPASTAPSKLSLAAVLITCLLTAQWQAPRHLAAERCADKLLSSFTRICRYLDASALPGSNSSALSNAAMAGSAWPRRPSRNPMRV